jgi:hypothetical protein
VDPEDGYDRKHDCEEYCTRGHSCQPFHDAAATAVRYSHGSQRNPCHGFPRQGSPGSSEPFTGRYFFFGSTNRRMAVRSFPSTITSTKAG